VLAAEDPLSAQSPRNQVPQHLHDLCSTLGDDERVAPSRNENLYSAYNGGPVPGKFWKFYVSNRAFLGIFVQ